MFFRMFANKSSHNLESSYACKRVLLFVPLLFSESDIVILRVLYSLDCNDSYLYPRPSEEANVSSEETV